MNNVSLMGRLTRDPEIRYTTTNNNAVASFTLAVDRRFQRQGEERQADFISVVAFGKTAEFVSKYFNKGRMMAVVGRIQSRTWDDAEGKKHYVTEVVADDVSFTGNSKRAEGAAPSGPRPQGNAPAPAGDDGFYPLQDDDDLPF